MTSKFDAETAWVCGPVDVRTGLLCTKLRSRCLSRRIWREMQAGFTRERVVVNREVSGGMCLVDYQVSHNLAQVTNELELEARAS